ncbi:hypothetical protein HIM_06219 [Hirsutella minnesotensis 3608]|uniref:37S ribosomal protein S19 n=1 Tax=Hirsutella minnesotensis 3608 TaxID=1043627 RepID=A0A0F8A4Y9_9HYPO|nr:hypothetical protein HIM_06219 [Hirsutella minnesotensis 3608]
MTLDIKVANITKCVLPNSDDSSRHVTPSRLSSKPPSPKLLADDLAPHSTTMQPTRLLLKRSVWKGPHIVPLPIAWPKAGQRPPPVRTQARSATILPNFVGLRFEVHNGRDYHLVTITEDMVGHKLGEFSPYADSNHGAGGEFANAGI